MLTVAEVKNSSSQVKQYSTESQIQKVINGVWNKDAMSGYVAKNS